MKIKQLKNVPSALFRYFILIGLSFLILYPIFVTVMISLMQTSDFTNSAVRYLSLSPTLENYKTAAIFLQYWQTLLRSLALNIPLCLLEIVSCMLVAYGFARFKFKGNGILFGCVIMTLRAVFISRRFTFPCRITVPFIGISWALRYPCF